MGDQLVVGADRIGIVVGVPASDGSPPYIIKWQKDGHIAMVLPDQYSRIVPAGEPVAAGESVAAGEPVAAGERVPGEPVTVSGTPGAVGGTPGAVGGTPGAAE